MDALEVKQFGFTYAGAGEPALEGLDLNVGTGELALLCGPAGSGKTTLLRCLKQEISPVGERTGAISLHASHIGYVAQSPENQLVMDTVRHELAFGLENLGLLPQVIRRRMAETVNFFGIGPWLGKKVSELSGGQKQILNLAAVTAMQPQLLLLDEPTAQLDPIAAGEFLQAVEKIRRELGITVLMSEHRLEEILSGADRVIWMEKGVIKMQGRPGEWAAWMEKQPFPMRGILPAPARIWGRLSETADSETACPLSVAQGRIWAAEKADRNKTFICRRPDSAGGISGRDSEARGTALKAGAVWFRYGRQEDFVLREASLEILRGEIHVVLGGNGSGKTTFLNLLAGVRKPQRGKIRIQEGLRPAMLTQNPKAMLTADSVQEELEELSGRFGYGEKEVGDMLERFQLRDVSGRHPYDLSGGEQQKTALAKLLLLRPDLLLMDEPTKGLDVFAKRELKTVLEELRREGRTVLMVTHDLEFAAEVADRCSMLADGEIVCTDQGKEFFASNLFYTTQTNRMMRGFADRCVVPEDVAYE